jgi:hypothetical protein
MSTSQNPILGAMRKSFGNVITTTYNGKNVIRTKPYKKYDPKSKKQLKHRAQFKILANLYKSFCGCADDGFVENRKGKTAYNLFIAANFSTAFEITGEAAVFQYSRLVVSKGSLPKLDVIERVLGEEGILISYETGLGLPKVSETDRIVGFATTTMNKNPLYQSQVRGSGETGSILIGYEDMSPENIVSCYLYSVSADGKRSSDSVYIPLKVEG